MEEAQQPGTDLESSEDVGSKANGHDAQFTLYVGNLGPEANEEQLGALFAGLGVPTNVKVMRDKVSGMSAGFGFVTFPEFSVAERALESMNGQVAWGRPLKLQWAQQRGGAGPHAATPAEGQSFDVFVGDLARDIDEQKLREAFSHLGKVTRVVVMWDYPTGRNKGYGFVSFATQQEAEVAIQKMHGVVVGSRSIRCGWGQRRAQQAQPAQHQFPGRGGRPQQQQAQQQQWGGATRASGQVQFPPGGGFPQLAPLMMSMQLGMDPQQAQHMQQLAAQQQVVGAFQPGGPMGEGLAAVPPAAPAAAAAPIANGAVERPGPRGGKAGKGGAKAPQPLETTKAHMDVQGSSVSLPALAERSNGGASGSSGCCVRVDNVDKTVQKAELFSAFAKFGTLEDCNIIRKGNPYHAIIRFGTPQSASDAAAAMNGFSLDGRRLRCAVEGASPSPDASALPRPKSTSDIPMPPRGVDRSNAVKTLAAKMRAVLQDRGELPMQSPPAATGGGGRGGAAAGDNASAAALAGGMEHHAGGFAGTGPQGHRGLHSPAYGAGAAGGGSGGGFGAGPRPNMLYNGPHHPLQHAHQHQPQHVQHMHQSQHAQHAPHQWMSPGQHLHGEALSPRGASGRQGGGGGSGTQHAKQPPPNWAQQPQHMLAPQLLVQQMRSVGAGGAPLMQSGMAPMAYGAGGVVLPPQLAMLNMMAQGVPGAPPAFTLPMMGYGGQQMMSPPAMQPGFAALQQQALIHQLLLHQQAQHAAASEHSGTGAPAGPHSALSSHTESVPSTGGTPPPSSTPPPVPQPPMDPAGPADS